MDTLESSSHNGIPTILIKNNPSKNRDIRKIKKRHHQYAEFGHTQGEIEKKLEKKYISIQGGVKLRKASILSCS
jgi:hypothetical protein